MSNSRKKILYALLLCAFIAASTGCGTASNNATDAAQSGASIDGQAENLDDQESAGETGDVAGDDDSSNSDTQTSSDGLNDASADEAADASQSGADMGDASGNPDTIYNNNAHFVRRGDKVYFRVPRDLDEVQIALWGDYADRLTSQQKIMELSLADMSVTDVEGDCGWGIMGISGDHLYFKDVEYNNDIECILMIDMELSSGDYVCDTLGLNDEFVGVTPDGKLTVAESFRATGNGHYVTEISVYKDSMYMDSYELEDVSEIGGLSDERLFYCDGDALYQMNLYTGITLKLGDLPEADYGGGAVDQFEVKDNMVYLGYSFYEGTGHFYSEGYYLTAQIDMEDSLTYDPISSEWTEEGGEEYHPFCVQNGQPVEADGIPETAFIDYSDGVIGYYDAKGQRVDVCDGFSTVYYDNDNMMMNVELAELAGDKIFFIWNTNIHEPDEDIGWRTAYRRIRAEYYMADINTGEVVLIAQK